MLKKKFTLYNTILLGVFILFIFKQAPTIASNLKTEGKTVISKEYNLLNSSTELAKVTFPPVNKKTLLIFWASWCAPCSLEMKRLENSVNNGKIPRESIFAINPFEEASSVKDFIKKNPYPFQFIDGGELGYTLNINATPTTMFLDGNSIFSTSSGLSILGIYKAEKYLN